MIMRSPGEGNPIPPFEMQDPLSPLVANIQARARGELDSSAQRNEREAIHGENDGDASNPKALEVVKKGYKQLKGIETRINIIPVHCSKCAPAVTHKLLEPLCTSLSCNTE